MTSLNDYELNYIVAGSSLSGTLINSVSKLINTLLDLGRNVGSAIRYWRSGKTCKL